MQFGIFYMLHTFTLFRNSVFLEIIVFFYHYDLFSIFIICRYICADDVIELCIGTLQPSCAYYCTLCSRTAVGRVYDKYTYISLCALDVISIMHLAKSIGLHHITSHHITSHDTTLHYTALHYFTSQYNFNCKQKYKKKNHILFVTMKLLLIMRAFEF